MIKIFPILALIIILSVNAFAQTASPTPPPADEGDVVKISTTLIQLDVTVTDKKGNPIKDLRADEIEIYENEKRQEITNFSFISNVREQTELTAAKKEKSEIPIPTATKPKPENVRRTIALVVDDLTLSFASTYWVKQALKRFVNEQMQDGDLVAIIRTGGGVGALQQFTTNTQQLFSAIEKVRFNMSGNAKIGTFDPIAPTLSEQMEGTADAQGNTRDMRDRIEMERNAEREFNEFRESIFAGGTLGALNFVIRGMQELPGRKSIVLLSDGFRLFIRDDRGMPQASRIIDSLRRLTDLANRAAVVVYTIDARGLQITGLTAADDTFGLSSEQLERRLSDRRNELFDTQEGLTFLARQTGGFAIINNNDITRGIRRVLDDQSYYLIGYQPPEETFDPKTRRYNKIEVKVKRDGVRVRYRSGFFGISDDRIQKPQLTPEQNILRALTSPFAVNDISLRLHALYAADEKREPFVRSYLHIAAKDLKFTKDANGDHKTTFDIVAISFGDNGTVVDELSKNYSITLKEEAYQRMLRRGFVYHFTFPIKKSGGYQMRVALRDSETNKVGSASQFIEVPNLKKNRLTISGIVLESLSIEQWKKLSADPANYAEIKKSTDLLTDTSLRQFKRGSVLRYGFAVYNAKLDASQKPNLVAQARLIQDGKLFFEGRQTPLDAGRGQIPARGINSTLGLSLGTEMPLGEYILQVVVYDNLAKEKRKLATQFVQFEIIE